MNVCSRTEKEKSVFSLFAKVGGWMSDETFTISNIQQRQLFQLFAEAKLGTFDILICLILAVRAPECQMIYRF